ncbi:MAG: hypothetical protein KKA61_04065 [Nanoarchaeota archaeon]|nr:hypothetical protein [Nanoarchaeota archaeon]MBU4493520.1 hypothetical protein [Nanoarchaeota archaeon]
MYISKLFDLTLFETKYKQQVIELVAYSFIAFFVPFFIGHPQLLVGTMVNAALILSSLYLKRNFLLPVIFMPSIAVLSRGLIFGPFTIFLVYFIPFIWAGNFILTLFFKGLFIKKRINYFITLISAGFAKAFFLFLIALLFFKLNLIPEIFLATMGTMQFTTAILGGITAFAIIKSRERIKFSTFSR